MSRFIEAVRKLFGRKNENKGSSSKEEKSASHPNEVQKATRTPRTYDEVTIDGGAGLHIGNETETNNVKDKTDKPVRAPRPYDEVDVPETKGDAVQVK